MRLSPAAEFAVRGALVLAERSGQGPVTLGTICSQRDLSRQYLVKIFALLIKAGIITPVRGKRGGYLLARDPASITLLEVIEAVEGPIILNLCQRIPPRCDRYQCTCDPCGRACKETSARGWDPSAWPPAWARQRPKRATRRFEPQMPPSLDRTILMSIT